MTRYEAGETLASIARTYDCSPPAISYVVSRSRSRQPAPEVAAKPPGGQEPQLIKAAAPDAVASLAAKPPTPHSSAPAAANGHEATIVPQRDNHSPGEPNSFRPPATPQASNGGPSNVGNGTANPTAAPNGDRRTLHLSLGNPAHRNGGSQPVDMKHEPEPPLLAQPTPEPAQPIPAPPRNGNDGAAPNGVPGMRPTGYPEHHRRHDPETAPRKDGGAFIDLELRARVDGDIAAFLAAFDAALGNDTQESRAALREATDRLLRAGARTRIELERLEARMPLPPRNDGRSGEATWRPR
jgi:hypothetical protein